MNREIKFRVFYKGVMIYDVTVATSPLHIWIYDEKIPKDVPDDFYDGLIEGKAGYWILGGFELMQYADKKDPNGRHVYEGDILKLTYKDNMEESGYGVVYNQIVFSRGSFCWVGENTGELFTLFDDDLPGEVAGNIYENPELLEE